MTRIARLAFSAALAFAAFGAGAQTIETDYPAVGGSAAAAMSSSGASGSQAFMRSEPYLIQSNAEGVRVNPEFARASTVSRAQVQREAVVQVPQSAGHNA